MLATKSTHLCSNMAQFLQQPEINKNMSTENCSALKAEAARGEISPIFKEVLLKLQYKKQPMKSK